jgi:hypothetical protein
VNNIADDSTKCRLRHIHEKGSDKARNVFGGNLFLIMTLVLNKNEMDTKLNFGRFILNNEKQNSSHEIKLV